MDDSPLVNTARLGSNNRPTATELLGIEAKLGLISRLSGRAVTPMHADIRILVVLVLAENVDG